LVESQLAWLTGTSFPAPPAGLYISLLRGAPLSDGSTVAAEEIVRVGPVAFTTPQTASGQPGYPSQRFIQPTAAVSFTPPGAPAPGLCAAGLSWALFGQASGGNPLYVAGYSWRILIGVATSLPAVTFQVFAESA
jgi:hypothetical protein